MRCATILDMGNRDTETNPNEVQLRLRRIQRELEITRETTALLESERATLERVLAELAITKPLASTTWHKQVRASIAVSCRFCGKPTTERRNGIPEHSRHSLDMTGLAPNVVDLIRGFVND